MNIKSKLKNRYVKYFSILALLLMIAYAIMTTSYVYKGITVSGQTYDSLTNTTVSMGKNNWQVEYVLKRHYGSSIEASDSSGGRQLYTEWGDIGQISLKMVGDCPYINDIEKVHYSVDWGMVEPFYSGGCLNLEDGFIYWEDGVQVIDGYGYRNKILQNVWVNCELSFYLKDGRRVTEYTDLFLNDSTFAKIIRFISF